MPTRSRARPSFAAGRPAVENLRHVKLAAVSTVTNPRGRVRGRGLACHPCFLNLKPVEEDYLTFDHNNALIN